MYKLRKFLIGPALVGAFVLTSCSDGGGESASAGGELETTDITFGLFGTGLGSREVMVADELGYFEDAGLNVEFESVGSPGDLIPLLSSSQIDMAYGGYASVFNAMNAGVDIELVTHYHDLGPDQSLFVASDGEIEDVGDLGGSTIGVLGVGGYSDLLIGETLAEYDLSLDDVDLVEISFQNVPGALESGQIDAGFLGHSHAASAEVDPAGRTEKLVAFSETESLSGLPEGGNISRPEFVQENPNSVSAFTEAVEKAADYLAENPDWDREFQIEVGGFDPDTAEVMYLPEYQGEVDLEDLQQYADLMQDYELLDKTPDLESFSENS